MKAVKSENLKQLINSPANKDKFRRFIATRSADSGQFETSRGTKTVVFVLENPEKKDKQK